ncbi:clathrin assembly protein [Dorcoceras hygrometricum]|uniref:Clathrin assembly protein n=1 Tax=Dorcoceras hygrometricum TaxID=472368 RepID=A0A2Z7B673_9LAMI|nr:clathrin assembly protein [Dorcoceras hygrometricum]
MELFLTLGRKCEEISPQNVILQYLAPHRKLYVTLNEDDDVRNMTHLHTCMRLTIIDMRAVKKDQMGARNVNRYVDVTVADPADVSTTSLTSQLLISLLLMKSVTSTTDFANFSTADFASPQLKSANSTTDFANFSTADFASPQLKSATSTTDFANFSTAKIASPQLKSATSYILQQ